MTDTKQHKSHTEHKSDSEHKAHSAHHHVKKSAGNIQMWKMLTGLFAILFFLSVFGYIEPLASGGGLSEKEASDLAVNYINTNLMQPGTTATLKSTTSDGNLYAITLDIAGREYTSYITKDGGLLFPSAVELVVPTDAGSDSMPATHTGTTGAAVDLSNLIDDDAVKGDPNAPVTIIEWSDYECPFCARFFRDTLPQITTTYIDTGKVKLVYRDFPLSFHPQAQKAAEAAECAGEQDSYFAMHDLLFEKGVSGGVASFKAYAAELGLDTGAFDTCLDSGQMASEVAKDMQDGQAAGVTGTPGFNVNGRLISGAQPFSAFQTAIEAALSGEAPPAAPAPSAAPSAPTARVTDMELLSDDDAFKGDADAPVVIVEFSDFQCPFCARFYRDTLPQLTTTYIDTGKVKLVYRDFPLSIHSEAKKSAEAAECAGDQGQFWEMHDLLFDKGTGGIDAYKAYAVELGLNAEDFDFCLDSGVKSVEVDKDFTDGQAAGITGTPGFIVNGQLVSGAQPFAAFAAIIDAELNK